jgi:hypothetical protein
MALDVSVSDLVRSYASLRDAADQTVVGPGGRLLLFYSTECGLKAAYLGKHGIRAQDTRSLPQDLRNHDLRRLAKALRIGRPGLDAGLSACRRRQSHHHPVDHHELHEAWRYGAPLHTDDEKRAVRALEILSDWCRNEHRR